MPATRNNDNVRIFGSLDDAVWVAPLGTPLPENLTGDLPAPWVPLGWLSDDGIALGLSTDVQTYTGHQGTGVIRTKVTGTERTLGVTALETNPVTRRLYHSAADAVATATPGVFRQDIPESVDTVAVAAVVFTKDKTSATTSVSEAYCIERWEITEREDLTLSKEEIAAYGLSGQIIGDSYILTDGAAFEPTVTGA